MLGDVLALAEPGGFVRIFVDEGTPMAHLLSEVASQGLWLTIAGSYWLYLKLRSRRAKINLVIPLPYLLVSY
jgi:LuxR family maltose regulon positive regulatory protein